MLAKDIKAVDGEISESLFVESLLKSLPESYKYLVIFLESRSEELTIEYPMSCLVHEEARCKEKCLWHKEDDKDYALLADKKFLQELCKMMTLPYDSRRLVDKLDESKNKIRL